MISSLSIQNYAIIEQLYINFSDNLSIITGETGAGKSIIMGALGLIMGKRADKKVLYQQDKKCIVEAVFDIAAYGLQDFFEEKDLDYEKETYIRREISTSGKSRAFVNDTPVRLDTLKALSNKLIDLHQQFDTHAITDIVFQTKVIDAMADNKKTLAAYQQLFKNYTQNKKKLAALRLQSQNASKEADFLQYQLNELLEAELELGEIEKLETEQKYLTNAEEIKMVLGAASLRLSEDEQSITNQMTELLNGVAKVAEFHTKLPQLIENFNSILLELQEVGNEFEGIAEETEHDENRLQEVDERLTDLYNLLHKHHVQTDEQLLAIQTDLEQRLGSFEDISAKIESLQKLIEKEETNLRKWGERLSKKRQKSAPKFQKIVQELLAQLSMPYARIAVEIVPTTEFLPTGTDRLRFLFAANKGSRLEDIKGVASGGEMSRLALCIKSLVATVIPLPTLIFDEIDSGVSGEIALQMGLILKKLSLEHQVISITHSPQIAAKANVHFWVHKKVVGEKTTTSICELNREERILEIAKMLSGNPPSKVAKENAKELLGGLVLSEQQV